jgi:hypothetical protein
MTFKRKIWLPISLVLSVVNLVAVGFAAAPGEPVHATLHAALALAFGVWAQRLWQAPGNNTAHASLSSPEVRDDLDALDGEVGTMQRELSEMQERLDFAERMLAQGAEARRVESDRQR